MQAVVEFEHPARRLLEQSGKLNSSWSAVMAAASSPRCCRGRSAPLWRRPHLPRYSSLVSTRLHAQAEGSLSGCRPSASRTIWVRLRPDTQPTVTIYRRLCWHNITGTGQ